ncbi:MAG: LAGLIDADG family homing endonuclease [Lachnospiraceae bacterium]|nr:LAGLIDADG family homing endonuclease [Lachnospiraceae bacterium]
MSKTQLNEHIDIFSMEHIYPEPDYPDQNCEMIKNQALADFRALLLDALPADAAYVKIKAAYEWLRDYIAADGSAISGASPEELAKIFQYLLEQIGCASTIRKEEAAGGTEEGCPAHFLNVVEMEGKLYDIDVLAGVFPEPEE